MQAETNSSARDRLISATSELMKERESVSVSLSDVARRAGLNSALVKYYFGSKDGLLLALFERDSARALDRFEALLETELDAITKLRMHVGGLINTYFKHPYLNRLMFLLTQDPGSPIASELAEKYIKRFAQAYSKLMAEGEQTGKFRSIDPTMLYFTVTGACDQLFAASFVFKLLYKEPRVTDDVRQKFIEHTVSLILRGVCAEPEKVNATDSSNTP